MFTTDRRLLLHEVLEALKPGLKVYFQPPETATMVYPCIVYEASTGSSKFANNVPYNHEKQYQIKLISRTPAPDIYDKLAALPKTKHDRFFVTNNLNHHVFSIYF